MKRLIIAAAVFTAATGAIFASPLTPDEALERISRSGSHMRAPSTDIRPELVNTTHAADGEPAVYLFDKGGRGFLIVSADDSTEPLLAYSDNGNLDGELPPQLEWWLEEYARQVQYNKDMGFTSIPRRTSPGTREAIAPQIQTDWDQGNPYNLQCPLVSTERTYTGCVATAMAQVLKYWEYPERGKGQISYNAQGLGKRLTLNFALRAFDWDNMLPTYNTGEYTEAQANAVAYLMKACGYAVKMEYGIDSSGAYAMNIADALVRYFDYDPNIRYTLRQYYSTSEWTKMIYENLRDVGPVLYGGGSLIGGGHSFICDGYDGNGYFHFNWGWTGMSNGYFSLDALNPYALGAGGGSGGGYNFTQDAVLGIRPPTGETVVPVTPTLTQTGSLAAYIENDSLVFDLFASNSAMWVNYTPQNLVAEFGATFHNENNPAASDFTLPLSEKGYEVPSGAGLSPAFKPAINLAEADIPDGRYKVTIVNKYEGISDDWTPVLINNGYFDYIHFTKNGKSYTVENNDVDRLEVVSGEIVGDFYYGTASKVRITVRNSSDRELSSGFAPAAIYGGQLMMLGESILLTLQPGETVTREWVTTIYSLSQYFNPYTDTEVIFTFFDEETYNIYGEDIAKRVVLKPHPGLPRIETKYKPSISNAHIDIVNVDGNYEFVYRIADKNDIQVKADIELKNGYFAYPMYACVTTPTDTNGQMALETYAGEVQILDTPGQICKFSTSLAFPGAVPDKTYYLMMGYGFGQDFVQIGPYYTTFTLASSGVEDVAIDTDEISFDGATVAAIGYHIEIFSIQGVKVAEGADRVETSLLAPGLYIVRAGDKSKKIVIK